MRGALGWDYINTPCPSPGGWKGTVEDDGGEEEEKEDEKEEEVEAAGRQTVHLGSGGKNGACWVIMRGPV